MLHYVELFDKSGSRSLLQNWGHFDRDPVLAGRLRVDGTRSP